VSRKDLTFISSFNNSRLWLGLRVALMCTKRNLANSQR
jgi:hypothetical protein